MTKKDRVFVITNAMTPLNKSGEVTTSKFVRTICGAYKQVIIVGGNVTLEEDLNNICIESYDYKKEGNKFQKLLGMFKLQRQMAAYIRNNVKKGNHVIFWLGDKMFLPFKAAKKVTDHVGYFVYGNLAAEGNNSLFMKLSAKLVMYMANNADRVFVESKAVKDGWNGQIKKDVYELHLYTDIIGFNPYENRKNKIGMLCRMAGVKHVIESIHAFHELHNLYPNWSLELVGSGLQENECKKLINELGADQYIKVYGWMNKESVIQITDEWKYNMLASDHEGLPNSMIEMMGKGIPIIATPVGGIPDLLTDNVNGFVLSGTTVSAIKDGLFRAIAADNYDELARNAFNTVNEKYSLTGAKREAAEVLLTW